MILIMVVVVIFFCMQLLQLLPWFFSFHKELIGDKSLEHFRLEYEKLHRALKKSLLQVLTNKKQQKTKGKNGGEIDVKESLAF